MDHAWPSALLATAFDLSALSPIGSPTPVLDPVPDLGGGTPFADISPAGLMVFSAQSPERRLMWVSRQGVEEPVNDTSRSYMNPRLSPDGTRIAVQAGAVWVYDLRRNAFERASANVSANAFPMWLTDGTTLIHRSGSGLRLHNVENGQERTLRGTTEFDYPSGFTADGRTLIFLRSSPETSFDIFAAPLDETSHVTPLVQTAAYEGGAQLSNDGRCSQPVWNPNNREIFYRNGDRMMAVDIMPAGNELRLSAPRRLFEGSYAYGAGITIANYDVTKDGQHFLMVKDVRGSDDCVWF